MTTTSAPASRGALVFLEPGATVGLRSQECARYGDVIRRDFKKLSKDALGGRAFGDGDHGGVVAISARRIGAPFHRNDCAMQLLACGTTLGFNVHKATARQIAAINNPPWDSRLARVTVYLRHC
jgi:hypothetical protein